jgi:hypothetical protein
LLGAALACLLASAGAATAASTAKRATVTVSTVKVGAPNNPSAAIVPFTDAIYQSCADVPAGTTPPCQTVGTVAKPYEIGELEVTVKQWVAFLNTVDPKGKDPHDLYHSTESGKAWPRFGQINFSKKAKKGQRYSVAYPEWADKPYGFANFLRAARFTNSLFNGKILEQTPGTAGGVASLAYRVRLSTDTETGMYDLKGDNTGATRSKKRGFVVPSQDEWIKSAYFDPAGGGTFSYWKYPTNAGVFGDGSATAPTQATLDPSTGDVTNAASQPLAIFHTMNTPAPAWCPPQVQPQSDCSSVNPFGINPTTYAELYQGSLGTVGQSATRGPWGTLDQGGNVVEWTDTITPPPGGKGGARVWRRLHGGIANAPVYQLWLSAVGLQPEDNRFFERTYPWLGFRVGRIGPA